MHLENPHVAQEQSLGVLSSVHEKLVLTGAALGALAYRGYSAERHGKTNELPEPLRDMANSTAHPWIGFTAAGIILAAGHFIEDRTANDRTKRIVNRGKYAAAVLVGTAANFAVEALQDAYVHPRHLFTDPASRYESTKDYLAAMLGVGIACAVQTDFANKIKARYLQWKKQE